ncbi:MAG: uL15m family ribosomal protein [Candidatus Hodarchaeota archaeon]
MRKFSKRIRKMRGTRTCGYGKVGQHRKTGQRAGRGKTTQWKKSKRSLYLKQKELGFPDPDWIMGKRGFKRPQDMVRLSKINAINVKGLDYKIEKIATKSADTYTINLDDLNIQKLLGRGQTNKKINVSVKKASKRAIEKIEAAGGRVTLLSEAK